MKHRNSFPLTVSCWAQLEARRVKIADLFAIRPTFFAPPRSEDNKFINWSSVKWAQNHWETFSKKPVKKPTKSSETITNCNRLKLMDIYLKKRWKETRRMSYDMRSLFFCLYCFNTGYYLQSNKWHHCVPPVLERWSWIVGKRATIPLDSFPGRRWKSVT